MNATRVAAYAVALDAAGRILLVRIAQGYPAAGQWTLPGGGVGFGEDPADAVIREFAEETGLDGRVIALAFVQSRTGTGDLGAWHAVRIVYEVEITGGDLRDEVDESTDSAAWFTLSEARTLPIVDVVNFALESVESR